MIAHLAGTVLATHPGFLILDVGGVGYRVHVTERARTGVTTHDEVSLFIHTAVREDSLNLFGFPSYEELELFELLIGISGIGPRSALGIIGLESIETLVSAIAAGDVAYLTKVSGVGKKSAEKIVLELQDKVAALPRAERRAIHDGEEDILEALRALGYRADEAREALRRVPDEVVDQGARIKDALRFLSRS
jgi:Holliday junction DNA helicase RuvA